MNASSPSHASVATLSPTWISYWNTQRDTPEPLAPEATTLERLRYHVLDGDITGSLACLNEALKQMKADIVACEALLPIAQELTDLFNNMEMLLPFVLQGAAVLRQCWAVVLPRCERFAPPATCVMLTVAGDTHEVGKNIVDTLLQAHGISVWNLGAQVETETLLNAVRQHTPDAVIMSGLLVESGKRMKQNIQGLREAGLAQPVILGGPGLTPAFVRQECRAVSPGYPVLHARSAMDTLAYMQSIGEAKAARKPWHPPANAEPQPPTPGELMGQAEREQVTLTDVKTSVPSRQVPPVPHIPQPPFWGVKQVDAIALEAVYPFLNHKVLMTGHWGFRRWDKTPEEQEGFIQAHVQPIFEELKAWVTREGILQPRVRYGYFPVLAQGDSLIVYEPQQHDTERARFTFPRGGKKQLCLSDYVLDEATGLATGQRDVLALQLVTLGEQAAKSDAALFAQGDYMRYYLYHGFSVEMAEALAEYWHAHIRQELHITAQEAGKTGLQLLKPSAYQGCRYSFGYPACPALADQTLLMELLKGEALGVGLTENFMLVPEQSTSALVFHHPEAYYFDVIDA
jgi:5-methyltetrahydrofolate--homocysteine methyltransferase